MEKKKGDTDLEKPEPGGEKKALGEGGEKVNGGKKNQTGETGFEGGVGGKAG